MVDPILISLCAMAEAEKPMEIDITLIVGGFLISGNVTNSKTYFKHHPIPEGILRGMEAIKKEDPGLVEKFKNAEKEFIYLRDAKYFLPGTDPIPMNMSVFVRISLDSIHGFSFGKISVSHE